MFIGTPCIIYKYVHVCWDTLHYLYICSCLLGHPASKKHIFMFIGTPSIIYAYAHVCWDTLHHLYICSCLLGHPVSATPMVMFIGTPCIAGIHIFMYTCISCIHCYVYWDTLYQLYILPRLLRHPVSALHMVMFIRTPCISHTSGHVY